MKKEQPQITLNSRWKDSWGVKITVTRIDEHRITFIRDGYEHDCRTTADRLRKEFIYLPAETKKYQEAAKRQTSKKLAELRSSLPITFGSEGWNRGLK